MSTEQFSVVSLSRLASHMPLELQLLALALACLIVVFWKLGTHDVPGYEKVGLLTKHEQDFFYLLQSALPCHLIFPHVAMREIVNAVSGPQRARARTLLDQQYIDFVVCTRTLDVVCAVQLETCRQAGADDRARIMTSAGISTLRFSTFDKPTIEQLHRAVYITQFAGREQP